MDKEQLESDIDFLEQLDINKLKYEISDELGELTDKAGVLLDEAEREREVIPPKIAVRITSDKLLAYQKVITLGRPIAITEDDIRGALEKNNVVKKIIEKSIEEILVENGILAVEMNGEWIDLGLHQILEEVGPQ